jgi:flagellar biogenesis protein FliO
MSGDLAMLGRVVGGLIVVLVTIALVARVARRARGENAGSGLRIVERIGLSREANLAVVEISDRRLLLGVTAQGVTMLADIPEPAASVVLAGTEVSGESEVFAVPASRREARQARTGQSAVAGAVKDSLRRQLGLKKPADEGRRRRGDRGGRGMAPEATRDPALVPHTVSAPENIDDDDLRESEDAASELAASFATAPAEYFAPVEHAPVDALLADVRDSADSADSLAAPRPSGRRAAGPPQDATPRTRAENRASLRDAPAEEDQDQNTALPGDLNLDEYPDLASALRAAGRTAAEPKPQPAPPPRPWFEPQPGPQLDPRPIPAPRPGAESSRRRSRGPRSTYVPDSPAALLETSAPQTSPQASPHASPQASPPARTRTPGQLRPQVAPRPRPEIRPEARLRTRPNPEMLAPQHETLTERTARQVAAFQAEAYPDAVGVANRTGGGKRAATAPGRHPAQPSTAPTASTASTAPAPRAQSVLPERPHQQRRPQPAPPAGPRTRAQAQGRTPEPPPAQPSGRRSQQEHPQVNGSVLSPRTWRQGVDALRDLTVRRS